MPVCGPVVGGGKLLWEWNGLPWEHLIEKQCEGRRGRYRMDSVGGGGQGAVRETQRQNA